MKDKSQTVVVPKNKTPWWRDLKMNRGLYLLSIPIIAFFAVFNYAPMSGLVIAFVKEYISYQFTRTCNCISAFLTKKQRGHIIILKQRNQETKKMYKLFGVVYTMEGGAKMQAAMMKGSVPMEMKKISISEKRQITIPQKFFAMLGFDTEAECIVRGNELVLRPVKTNTGGEFAEQILADLIAQGLSGEELLNHFKKAQKEVRPAVEAMLAEAEQVAGANAEYVTYEDIFGTEE